MTKSALSYQKFLDLNKHAEEGNFPALNHPYFKLGDARLTAYRSENDWAIFFEIVSWSVKEEEFGCDMYAFGTCIYPEGLKSPGAIVVNEASDAPMHDAETGDCIASWDSWSVIIKDRKYDFTPDLGEYVKAGIIINSEPRSGSISEAEILRFLVHKLGHVFFQEDKDLLVHAHQPLAKFLQTTDWQHPDVLAGELPSENISLHTLYSALVANDTSKFNPGRVNSHWTNWSGKTTLLE